MLTTALASLEYLNLGYIVTDMAHKVLLINHFAKQLLVSTGDLPTLESVVEYIPKRLALLDHVKYCSVEHKSCSFREVELGDKTVRLFLSPIFENDELKGNLITLEDITEKIAQEHARNQFLSFLVHELRTPLTAIRGSSSLIEEYYKDALKDKALHELVNDISTGSQNVLQMVNQFLDMSRLEEGRIAFDLQEFEAMEVVRDTVHSLKVIAKDRNLTLSLDSADDFTAQVVGDPGRVRQVLTNLVGNALKFTEKGSVTVSTAINKEMLEVNVTDTGAGIPEESRANMFQKYFQAANNTMKKDSSKSTGIGLYVTKLMVEGMSGKIFLAKTELNKGSTFTFAISLATPARLKQLTKELNDTKQGVQHAQVSEHSSIRV